MNNKPAKPELIINKVSGLSEDEIIKMVENLFTRLTGRKPTEQEMIDARKELQKGPQPRPPVPPRRYG